jgi:hypothetical protein
MGTMLKLLQCAKFIYLHTLVIGVKLFEELGDKVGNRN